MNPDVWLHASVLVAVVGLGLSAAAIWAAREVAPASGLALASVVSRLLDARHGSRVYKLCLAAPRMAALAGVRAMLDAATGRSAEEAGEAGYREGSSLSVEAFQQKLRRDFDAAASGPLRALSRSSTLSLFGLLAAIYALELGLAERGPRVGWAAALVATLGAQGCALRVRRSARRRTAQVREDLVEPMTRAWRSGALADAEPPPDQLHLLVSEAGGPERVVTVPRGIVKLGSGPSCTVVLAHPSVARLQAVLEEQDGEVSVIDLGSDSPTRVNGETVTRRRLEPGDVLALGEVSVRVVGAVRLDQAQESSSG